MPRRLLYSSVLIVCLPCSAALHPPLAPILTPILSQPFYHMFNVYLVPLFCFFFFVVAPYRISAVMHVSLLPLLFDIDKDNDAGRLRF